MPVSDTPPRRGTERIGPGMQARDVAPRHW